MFKINLFWCDIFTYLLSFLILLYKDTVTNLYFILYWFQCLSIYLYSYYQIGTGVAFY